VPKRWEIAPEGATWGEFGPDDEYGRINLLTPEVVKRGVAEVREGKVFCLSLPLDYPGGNLMVPRRHPPVLKAPYEPDGERHFHYHKCNADPRYTDVMNDDMVTLWPQYSTQWDALAHIGSQFDADGDGEAEIRYYNGFRGGEDVLDSPADDPDAHGGALALGIDRLAVKGMMGRGVLVDLEGHYGRAYRNIGYDDLMRVLDVDGVEVEAGDMLCLHTGFDDLLLGYGRKPPDRDSLHKVCCALNGRDQRLLKWITDSRFAALVADTFSIERPGLEPEAGSNAYIPLHEHCLFKIGMPMGELWFLSELKTWLKQNGRSRFLLTAPPLRLPRAVGSPVTPLATV
jgi:kynurenine formamidase